MTYFGFLAIFVGIPLAILGGLTWYDLRRGRSLAGSLHNVPGWLALVAHVIIAVLYTTAWDNYLVATGVWWYDPALVTGVVLGWVPIEEYTFFVVQTVFTGLWLLFLGRRLKVTGRFQPHNWLRWASTLLTGVVWLAAVLMRVAGWRPGTYLALTLVWALPPIMLQLAFGADILWRYRQLVLLTLVPTTVYLSVADAIAIQSGTWTIDPQQSLHIMLAGQLPVEELIFFFLTNTLVTFGMVLSLARESRMRMPTRLTTLLAPLTGWQEQPSR
jgi:lycopene cyclase domain-containing protein